MMGTSTDISDEGGGITSEGPEQDATASPTLATYPYPSLSVNQMLRNQALEHAIRGGFTSSNAVKYAETYYQFLRGQ